MHEWMNEWTNTYNQTFRGLNESQIKGLCDFPQREQNCPQPSFQKQLTPAQGGITMLNYCLTTSHVMIAWISPGKSSPFSQGWEQLQFTGLGCLYTGFPLTRPNLIPAAPFLFTLGALSRNLTQELDASGKRFTSTGRGRGGWCPGVILAMTAPPVLPEKRHNCALFQIRPESLAFYWRQTRERMQWHLLKQTYVYLFLLLWVCG